MIDKSAVIKTKKIGKNTNIWQFCVILENAKIGSNCNICSGCFIENNVSVGNNVTIKNNCCLYDGISIEDNCFVGPNVVFCNDRYPRSKNIHFKLEKTIIKNGASIGANCTIVPGVIIGSKSLIGAGSVVTKNVPAKEVWIGNPAKFLRKI